MLSDEQKASFDRDGFLVVDKLLDIDSTVAPVREEYATKLNELCQRWVNEGVLDAACLNTSFEEQIKATYAAGLDYFQPLDISLPPGDISNDTPFHFGPAIFNLMTAPELLDAAESLIGPELTSNPIQHVRIKPPAVSLDDHEDRPHITSTDWHQDRAVTLDEADATQMVTIWVAITDATVNNGCLQVIPGSHRGEMLHHCPTPQLGIPQQLFKSAQAKALPIPAGGAILFHPLTVHGSLENKSDEIRWSFDLRFNVTGQPTGRPMFPDFIARSVKDPSLELHDATRYRELWEQTRAELAVDQPVTIHRWPADAPPCA